MKFNWTLIGLLPLTLAAACGGEDDDDGGGSSVPLEDLPAEYASSLCGAFERCAAPLFEVFLVGEDCVELTTARVEEQLPSWEQAIDDGRITYHGDQVSACAADINGRDCAELNQRGSGPCESVFTGSAALGESCSLDEECEGEAFCDFGATCPGTCRELAGDGEACNENDDCASGLTCSDSMQVCEEPAGAGDLCGAGNPECVIGYICAGEEAAMDQPGNCRSYDEFFAGGEGDTCNPTEGELCQTNLSCHVDEIAPLSWICGAKVGSGGDCRPGFPDPCPDDEYCNATLAMLAEGVDGTCEQRPGPGAPCGGIDSSICAAGSRCNGGTCKELTEIGGGCMVDAVCYSERCVGGECVSANTCE